MKLTGVQFGLVSIAIAFLSCFLFALASIDLVTDSEYMTGIHASVSEHEGIGLKSPFRRTVTLFVGTYGIYVDYVAIDHIVDAGKDAY